MMTSTYLALRSQGLPIRKLKGAAAHNFTDKSELDIGMPDPASWSFWNEMIASRAAFRLKTGFEIEAILGRR